MQDRNKDQYCSCCNNLDSDSCKTCEFLRGYIQPSLWSPIVKEEKNYGDYCASCSTDRKECTECTISLFDDKPPTKYIAKRFTFKEMFTL